MKMSNISSERSAAYRPPPVGCRDDKATSCKQRASRATPGRSMPLRGEIYSTERGSLDFIAA